MKDQLIQYVNLLFAGIAGVEDIKQEILQNTLDRYDDLIEQGKSPEAAYRLAISGIGDLEEILQGCDPMPMKYEPESKAYSQIPNNDLNKVMRAVAIGLYIISILPLIVLDELFGWDILGLCCTLILVAVATVILLVFRKPQVSRNSSRAEEADTIDPLKKSINSLIGTVTLVIYLIVSFTTHAWHITWLVFPISAAVRGLADACIDLIRSK